MAASIAGLDSKYKELRDKVGEFVKECTTAVANIAKDVVELGEQGVADKKGVENVAARLHSLEHDLREDLRYLAVQVSDARTTLFDLKDRIHTIELRLGIRQPGQLDL